MCYSYYKFSNECISGSQFYVIFYFYGFVLQSDFFFRLMVNEHNISCVFDDGSEFERV